MICLVQIMDTDTGNDDAPLQLPTQKTYPASQTTRKRVNCYVYCCVNFVRQKEGSNGVSGHVVVIAKGYEFSGQSTLYDNI